MRKFVLIIGFFIAMLNVAMADMFINEYKLSVLRGYRYVNIEKVSSPGKIDFLNHVYTRPDESDYQYTNFEAHVKFLKKYKADLELSLRNNLIPYSYKFTLTYLLQPDFYLLGGSFSERFYFTEFNGQYAHMYDYDVSVRYLSREWNFSFLGIFAGAGAQYSYRSFKANFALQGGFFSVLPFEQRNIIKQHNSNYKMVYNYRSKWNVRPFIMPHIRMEMDILRHKNIYWGMLAGAGYFYSKYAVQYKETVYEWTYEAPHMHVQKMPAHNIQQFKWNFGVYVRW